MILKGKSNDKKIRKSLEKSIKARTNSISTFKKLFRSNIIPSSEDIFARQKETCLLLLSLP